VTAKLRCGKTNQRSDRRKDTVTLAALAWRGVGGRGSDAEFDSAFAPWLGPVRHEAPNR
jgi:hypothetical protein